MATHYPRNGEESSACMTASQLNTRTTGHRTPQNNSTQTTRPSSSFSLGLYPVITSRNNAETSAYTTTVTTAHSTPQKQPAKTTHKQYDI